MSHCCFGKNQFTYVLSGGIDTRSRTCVVMINVTYIEKSSVKTWAINLSVRVFDLLQKGDSDFVGIGSWLESNQIIAGDRRGPKCGRPQSA